MFKHTFRMYHFKSSELLILWLYRWNHYLKLVTFYKFYNIVFFLQPHLTFSFSQFKSSPPAVTFKLSGETDGIFHIQDGLLYHNRALDRETRAVHKLQVSSDQKKEPNSNISENPLSWKLTLAFSPLALHPVRALLTLMACFVNFICPFLPTTEGYGRGPFFFRLFHKSNPTYIAKDYRWHYLSKYGHVQAPGSKPSQHFPDICLYLLCGFWTHKEGSISAGMELLWTWQKAGITNGQRLTRETLLPVFPS